MTEPRKRKKAKPSRPARKTAGKSKRANVKKPQAIAPPSEPDDFGPPSPPPSPPPILAVPDDVVPRGDWYDAAAVADEPWSTDHAGDDELFAYRTGRAIHAIGWLALASRLCQVDRFDWTNEPTASKKRAAENLTRLQRFRERSLLVVRSMRRLTTLLVESAHRLAGELAVPELVPAIKSHMIAVQEVGRFVEEWRDTADHHRRITEDVVAAHEPDFVRFPFDHGPKAPDTHVVLAAFDDAVPQRLRDLLHLGIAVDASFRGPVPLHGRRHHWLGMVPSAAFRVRPDESGKLTGLCSRLDFDRRLVDRVRELVDTPRGPQSIDEIDDLIRGALRNENTVGVAVLPQVSEATSDESHDEFAAEPALGTEPMPDTDGSCVELGEIELDAASQTIRRRGFEKTVVLAPEMWILFAFVYKASMEGRTITKKDWFAEFVPTGGAPNRTDSIRQTTRRLNKRLETLLLRVDEYNLRVLRRPDL